MCMNSILDIRPVLLRLQRLDGRSQSSGGTPLFQARDWFTPSEWTAMDKIRPMLNAIRVLTDAIQGETFCTTL